MAKVLKFVDSDPQFTLLMDGFLNTMKQDRDMRVAAKILDKIDDISHPKNSIEDLDETILDNPVAKAFALALRELNAGGGEIILDDREFEYLRDCIKQAGFKHFIAQQGRALEEWLDGLKSVKVKKDGTKLTLVPDEPKSEATDASA